MSCLFFSRDAAVAEKLQGLGLQILVVNHRISGEKFLVDANISVKSLNYNDVDLTTVSVVFADFNTIDPKDFDTMNLIRKAALQSVTTTVLLNQSDLQVFLESGGNSSYALRRSLASKAYSVLSSIDIELSNKLSTLHKVLVLGSGGREHAIVHSLLKSESISDIIIAPGNGSIVDFDPKSRVVVKNASLDLSDITGVVAFAKKEGVTVVAVGPEQPLVDGIVDAMTEQNIICFGPSSKAAQIEASKAWSKDFMSRHGIPTASYKNFTNSEDAITFISEHKDTRFVIKASGLAAGKGVILPVTLDEAVTAVNQIMIEKVFGEEAGREIVIEEFLKGEEVSILAFCDGIKAVTMPPAQDHKRVFDNDEGPNTGGMGAYAPAPVLTPALSATCLDIIQRSVRGLAAEGLPYKGVLYTGFMLTKKGPYVLEYNCRFGDPETQVLLPLLKSDLLDIVIGCATGNLKDSLVQWHDSFACTVVCASPGYPGNYPKNLVIEGVSDANKVPDVTVYHAGTTEVDGKLVTNGGRVLSVTGMGASLKEAVAKAYVGVGSIKFDGIHYRKDIAKRGLTAPVLIGVLGSTRGSSLQPIIDAIAAGTLNAKIAVIVTNKSDAGIIDRAVTHGIPVVHIDGKGLSRADYDKLVSKVLSDAGVQLVLMIGYMRITSPVFTQRWAGRCLNVHPSLLPDFAGGMDLQVHEAVLKARKTKTGCTVHLVTDEVDGGPTVIQKECPVNPDIDTAEDVKARVQPLEGVALIEAIEKYRGVLAGTIPSMTEDKALTYKSAGVDIDAGEALVEIIKPYCKATIRPGCDAELGGFGGLFDLSQAGYNSNETVLVSGTDGVGTKLKIAQSIGKHDTIGIDLVAMCVNDILVCGAEPLFFLDYYATGALNVEEAAEVVKGIAEGCLQSGSSLIGGETAEMAGMYGHGEYDLAGFSVGAVKRSDILPRNIASGDVLIGLRSSGVHSNGYSLVRKCVEKSGLGWQDPAPFQPGSKLGEALLTPTRIYVKTLMPLIKEGGLIKGLAHITGGGLSDNIPRILADDQIADINITTSGWVLPPVLNWLQSIAKLPQSELLRTFNCGIGMVIVVPADKVEYVLSRLVETEAEFNPPYLLGSIQTRSSPDLAQVQVTGELL